MRIIQTPLIYAQRPGGPAQVAPANAGVSPEPKGSSSAADPPAVLLYSTRQLHAPGRGEPAGLYAQQAIGPVIEGQPLTTSHRQALAVQAFNRVAEFDGTPAIIDVYA